MPGKSHSFILNQAFCHQVKWLKRKINTALALRRNRFIPITIAA